jgi:NADH-quinone oxidoreductase subunit F
MGISIGTIIYDIGGGIPNKKKFKAVQLGGPSGGCIPVEHLNAPVDYESIVRLGAIVGSGGMIVMDEEKCVVDIARFFMDFCKDESCGKCTPCRVGTKKMLEILTKICDGKGEKGDLETLEKWADIIKNTALCGLGQTAPNPVLSTLRYFREEYEAHIYENRCPAAVCQAIVGSPCSHTCPIGMDIPGYIALIRSNRLDDAYKVLLKTNPFPAICGRVCDHKCESRCRRVTVDMPLSIKNLKRFITDHAGKPSIKLIQPVHEEKIAVIGAGPSGLTAAKDLALRGYHVAVFEQYSEPGGMMRWGIPEYRLPRDILKKEIEDILDLGVELKCNTRVGDDPSWDYIREKFNAVYIAIGAQKSLPMELMDDHLEGVNGAIEFLYQVNTGKIPYVGRKVVVVGGGNSAIDAARCALRFGAKEVSILYRRRKEDMPALEEEIRAAEEEGIILRCLATPVKIEGENGRLEKIICQNMTLGEFDLSGRKKSVPKTGDEFVLEADQLILAIGQKTDFGFDVKKAGFTVSKGGLIEVLKGKKTATSSPMIFAGGDVVTGPDTVVGAIATGHHAAKEIDEAICEVKGRKPTILMEEEIEIPVTVDEEIYEVPRVLAHEAEGMERKNDFREVELGFTEEEALKEAQRCLRCDIQVQAE